MNTETQFEHILDQALELLQQGKSVSEILLLFPDYADELKNLLQIGVQMKATQEEKNILKKVLQSLPEQTNVTLHQKQSYIYQIKRLLSSFHPKYISMNKLFSLSLSFVFLIAIIAGGFLYQRSSPNGVKDDWEFSQNRVNNESKSTGLMTGSSGSLGRVAQPASVAAPMQDTFGLGNLETESFRSSNQDIGFAVGGAKDINNFRENIKNGYLPLPTDITYEGLFYDYYFDTSKKETCDKLFCPSYSTAVSKDPISGKDEYYMAVGLNSNLKESDFQRKKLNLVVVLDISGSMESPFDTYHYDGNKTRESSNKSKMEIAKNVVADLTEHLEKDDRFGMVLFDDQAYMAKPLSLVGETDMNKIRDHIKEIRSEGGTNMTAGMEMGTDLFDEYGNSDRDEYENRIIFLTDAMPNTGDISRQGMMGQTETNADNKIYSTFIGIGVDFNTDLIESITKIRGANYYSVHSEKEFATRVDEQFEYMVTPLVFDLTLSLESTGFAIEKVYGSPEADQSTGEIMKVNTLFPSKSQEGQTKGGIVLLKLKKISNSGDIRVKVSYEDRVGKADSSEATVKFEKNTEYFENTGIRKGILLSRYANLLKNWTLDEQNVNVLEEKQYLWQEDTHAPRVNEEMGIVVPNMPTLSEWERTSKNLTVSSHYKKMFAEFNNYLQAEKNALGDSALQQEVEILNKLSK